LTHAHEPAPRSRRPAGAVDPAEVAARALAARESQGAGEADTDQADTGQTESGNADAGAGDDDSPELPEAASDQSLFASDD